MKTSKSPENTDVTPSKKKLKQARLPFKLITDVSPKPDPSQKRKRKLTDPDVEPVTKVGKICKENDLAKELVVISDDESKDASLPEKDDNIAITPHPFVKLVDNARKKKMQKAKGQKKSKPKLKKSENGTSAKEAESEHSQCEDIEMVDVEVIIREGHSGKSTPSIEKSESKEDTGHVKENDDNTTIKPISNDKETTPHQVEAKLPSKTKNTKESDMVICLDDSNNSCDVKADNSSDKALVNDITENSMKPVSVMINKTDAEAVNNYLTTDKTKKTDSVAVNILTPRRSTRSKTNSNNSSPVKTLNSKANKVILIEKSQPTDNEPDANEKIKTSDIEILSSDTENDSTPKDDSKSNKIIQKEDIKKQNNVTPKRSNWNKPKIEEKTDLNASSVSSKLNESVCSSPATPKHNKADESLNNSTPLPASLTPKQLQKRLESAKKREEREKEKQERDLKKQQEKEERAKQRQEKEDLKKIEREEKEEAKRREKEEKEEQRKKEKEDKEKQKELEKKLREQKEEEKRKERESKEEQRKKEKEARDEEKRKRQEALELEKQEQEFKKKKAAEAFANFFVPKQKVDKDQSVGPSKNGVLSSFTIKVDMRLAPTIRADLSDDKREGLDKLMEEQMLSKTELYLKCLKDGRVKPQSSGKTWPPSDKDDDDVMIVEDELPPIDGAGAIITCAPEGAPREKLRPKMLSFHENRRPPYWGTWRKSSARVTPRRPFGQDEKLLDYEVDSDDDWEEEAEGESLDGSVCGSDEEGDKDDYEVDNEVFVPHGYLSDEEATMDEEDDVLSLTPETQKARLKHLEDEFESEMKKPTEKLKPRMYGLLWEDTNGGKPDNCVDALWNYFTKYSIITDDPTPFLQPSKEPDETEKKKSKKKKVTEEGKESSPKVEKKKKVKEQKEGRKSEPKKLVANQPGINTFLLAKLKSS